MNSNPKAAKLREISQIFKNWWEHKKNEDIKTEAEAQAIITNGLKSASDSFPLLREMQNRFALKPVAGNDIDSEDIIHDHDFDSIPDEKHAINSEYAMSDLAKYRADPSDKKHQRQIDFLIKSLLGGEYDGTEYFMGQGWVEIVSYFALAKDIERWAEKVEVEGDSNDTQRIEICSPSFTNPNTVDNSEWLKSYAEQVNKKLRHPGVKSLFYNQIHEYAQQWREYCTVQLSPCAGQKNLRVKVEDSVSNG